MKVFFTLLLAVSSLLAVASPKEAVARIYIAPDRIAVSDQGIFVQHDDDSWETVEAIFSDTKGLYYCKKGYWRCSHCERCVDGAHKYCPHCLTPRYAWC